MVSEQIEAAGGVVWRITQRGVPEVAVVHRPKYDDWSLPKGKLNRGEHPLLAAGREVREETGYDAVLGRPLGEIRYAKHGQPKRVRYWAMRAGDGAFTRTEEVDELRWLPPKEAEQLLKPQRDLPILRRFVDDPRPTWAVVLVRHSSAGERWTWPADDRLRALDDLGRSQAVGLSNILMLYRIHRLVSADVLRCLGTLAPFAISLHTSVEIEPLMSETGTAADPSAAGLAFLRIAATGRATAVCSQGKSMPTLLMETCRALGAEPPEDRTTSKGGFWVLHLARQRSHEDAISIAGLERFKPVRS